MKIDLNEIDGLAWRGLTKLSFENGGDISPVKEGLAWNLHRLASTASVSGYNYDGGLAAWVNVILVLIGDDQAPTACNLGVFTNVEQRDKQFARNRGLWNPTLVKNTSWIYEQDDINSPVIEEGPDWASPQYNILCYPPFRAYDKKNGTPTPNDSVLYLDLTTWIDMEAMLTFAAVEAFIDNSDGLFTHGKNFLWGDYIWQGAPKRQYYVWDLDTAFRDVNALIYANSLSVKRGKVTYSQSPYQQIILNHPVFRAQYNTIFRSLLAQPLSELNIHEFLSAVEPALTPYLQADPFVQSAEVIEGSIPDHFHALRDWVSLRIPRVRALLDGNNTPPPRTP